MCSCSVELCEPCDTLAVTIAGPFPAELIQAIIYHLPLGLDFYRHTPKLTLHHRQSGAAAYV